MSPKEKAQELFMQCPIVECGDSKGIVKNDLSIEALKNVLIFMTDKLIEHTPSVDTYPPNCQSIHPGVREYWKEVKSEIKKI